MRESDGDLFSELSSYSVMRVDASIRRPPPSPLDQAVRREIHGCHASPSFLDFARSCPRHCGASHFRLWKTTASSFDVSDT